MIITHVIKATQFGTIALVASGKDFGKASAVVPTSAPRVKTRDPDPGDDLLPRNRNLSIFTHTYPKFATTAVVQLQDVTLHKGVTRRLPCNSYRVVFGGTILGNYDRCQGNCGKGAPKVVTGSEMSVSDAMRCDDGEEPGKWK